MELRINQENVQSCKIYGHKSVSEKGKIFNVPEEKDGFQIHIEKWDGDKKISATIVKVEDLEEGTLNAAIEKQKDFEEKQPIRIEKEYKRILS